MPLLRSRFHKTQQTEEARSAKQSLANQIKEVEAMRLSTRSDFRDFEIRESSMKEVIRRLQEELSKSVISLLQNSLPLFDICSNLTA